MRIFKNRLRRKLEAKRNELIKAAENAKIEQIKAGTLDQRTYCAYSVKISDLRDKVNLLTNLLS